MNNRDSYVPSIRLPITTSDEVTRNLYALLRAYVFRNLAGREESALTLFIRQALEGSLHHSVTGLGLAPPQEEGAIFDPDSFLLPETLQHPVVEFTSFLRERKGRLSKV